MMTSPLQLEAFRLRSISIEALPDKEKTGRITVGNKISVGQAANDSRLWLVELSVTLKDAPYAGQISVEGDFRVHQDYPDEKMSKLVAITGASMLYGSARDYVANLTARSLNGELLLPSVSFADLEPAKPDTVSSHN